ncbi:hypothetical protein C8R43DRAFT_305516 [Mycena crocata]|nr:hypothetical protein C8R43DRAFT_305516 [Mycena crocata]
MSTESPIPDIDNPSPGFVPTHPFADSPGADVILRSSDGADFHLHRTILSLVSPVFRDMFTLPQPESDAAVPVVGVQEGSAVLDRALRFFYPGAQTVIPTLAELREIIQILISKYDMECIIPSAQHHLERHAGAEPLAVYAVAIGHGWKDLALVAAKESLKLPIREIHIEAPALALGDLSAIAYHNLLHFHYRCAVAARSALYDLKSLPLHGSWNNDHIFGCSRCVPCGLPFTMIDNRTPLAPPWFKEFLAAMDNTLSMTPLINIGQHGNFYNAVGKKTCNCTGHDQLIAFGTVHLPAKIKEEIGKIELRF